MRIIDKEWKSRIDIKIDRVQAFRLAHEAKKLGIKRNHLIRIIMDAFLRGEVNIDEYKADWLKD